MPFDDSVYDGIYCFNLLHLLRKTDRAGFIGRCVEQLKDGGVVFFVVFSDIEPSFGTGRMVEENTFESKPGREVHYYSAEDLIYEFRDFEVIETGIIQDPEEHGEEGRHTHLLRYIFARKSVGCRTSPG